MCVKIEECVVRLFINIFEDYYGGGLLDFHVLISWWVEEFYKKRVVKGERMLN